MANVIVSNKLNQKVDIVVLDEQGAAKSVSIAPRGTFGPVAQARVGKHTKALAARGHVKIRPA